MPRPVRRLLVPALLLPVVAGASMFHLALKKAEPAKDATVATAPAALKLWFTEEPEVAVTKVSLAAASGSAIALGKATLDPSAEHPIVVPITGSLAPGAYTVTWMTMSHDGHPVRGTYGFTVTR